jgi:hypothetical protein
VGGRLGRIDWVAESVEARVERYSRLHPRRIWESDGVDGRRVKVVRFQFLIAEEFGLERLQARRARRVQESTGESCEPGEDRKSCEPGEDRKSCEPGEDRKSCEPGEQVRPESQVSQASTAKLASTAR